LGFTHSNIKTKYGYFAIYGLITKEDIQKNIKYLNTIYFLQTYKNWQAYEDQLARQNATQPYSSSDRYRASEENARQEREQKESEGKKAGLSFLENTDVDLIISKFGNQITKMKNFT